MLYDAAISHVFVCMLQRKYLQRFGGNNLKAVVKLIMRKLIDNSLALNMNYNGSGTKKYGLAQHETVCRVIKGMCLNVPLYVTTVILLIFATFFPLRSRSAKIIFHTIVSLCHCVLQTL